MKRVSMDVLYNTEKDCVIIFDVIQNSLGEYTVNLYRGPRGSDKLEQLTLYRGNTEEWESRIMLSILMYITAGYVDINDLPTGTNLIIPSWGDITHLPYETKETDTVEQYRKLSI